MKRGDRGIRIHTTTEGHRDRRTDLSRCGQRRKKKERKKKK